MADLGCADGRRAAPRSTARIIILLSRIEPSLKSDAGERTYILDMSTFLNHGATVVAFLVLAVLVAGLLNMVRSDSANMSQLLMRWRVGLQFFAIVLVMLSAWIARG